MHLLSQVLYDALELKLSGTLDQDLRLTDGAKQFIGKELIGRLVEGGLPSPTPLEVVLIVAQLASYTDKERVGILRDHLPHLLVKVSW